jgi:hypothetical protein
MMKYSDYSKWLVETDDLLKRFELLSRKVEAFMMEHFLETKAEARFLATNIVEVLQHCDTVDYDKPGVVEAYVALHFLDRFHRFQLVFQKLLQEKILPIKTLPIDVFDVGTGPAPALFALSDTYSSVNAYAEAANVSIPKLVVGNDYIEHSEKFRDWLHRFVEYANHGELRPWQLPYHHGSYSEFRELDPREERDRYLDAAVEEIQREFERADEDPPSRAYIIDNWVTGWKDFCHPDVVIFSNFLTSKAQVLALKKELRNMAESLRNRGIIVVVGARRAQYSEVYPAIKDILCTGVYLRKHSVARMREVDLDTNEMQYGLEGAYGDTLRRVRTQLLNSLKAHKCEDCVELSTLKELRKFVQKPAKPIQWALHVYQKTTQKRIRSRNQQADSPQL